MVKYLHAIPLQACPCPCHLLGVTMSGALMSLLLGPLLSYGSICDPFALLTNLYFFLKDMDYVYHNKRNPKINTW